MHHVIFTSVHALLLSDYYAGAAEGQLADSWRSSPDFKEWTFHFRPGLRFENGDPIRPQALASSWLRLVRVMKARHSSSGILKHLVGYDAFPERADTISGMTYTDDEFTLKFSTPEQHAIEDVSFGMYAVVHPSCYDHVTGKWLDPKKTLASGAYRIAEWDDHHVLLSLRDDFPAALRHERPLKAIDIRWEDKPGIHYDFVISSSRAPLKAQGYEYHGGAENGIDYVRLQSWTDPSSPLHDAGFRRRLRLAFYDELEHRSIHAEKSFFPLRFKGVHELSAALGAADRATSSAGGNPLRFAPRGTSLPFSADVVGALEGASQKLGFKFAQVSVPVPTLFAEGLAKGPPFLDDFTYFGTAIDLDDPDGDIRFMYQSKEGIALPDPTGRALKILKSPINIQQVNEFLWDDAIIWPVTHDSHGIWASSSFDLSKLNLLNNPTALFLFGWKG